MIINLADIKIDIEELDHLLSGLHHERKIFMVLKQKRNTVHRKRKREELSEEDQQILVEYVHAKRTKKLNDTHRLSKIQSMMRYQM